MRRFRFRLSPLLRLRAQYERTARRELAAAMAAVNALDAQIAAAAAGLRDCADQAARPDAIGGLAKALEAGLRRHHWRLTQQLQKAQQRLEAVRADYAQKAKDLKALERLRDQQRAAWREQAQRAEQMELEEIAAMARGALAAAEGKETQTWSA
jgi:flagellar export protein FliJ